MQESDGTKYDDIPPADTTGFVFPFHCTSVSKQSKIILEENILHLIKIAPSTTIQEFKVHSRVKVMSHRATISNLVNFTICNSTAEEGRPCSVCKTLHHEEEADTEEGQQAQRKERRNEKGGKRKDIVQGQKDLIQVRHSKHIGNRMKDNGKKKGIGSCLKGHQNPRFAGPAFLCHLLHFSRMVVTDLGQYREHNYPNKTCLFSIFSFRLSTIPNNFAIK